MKPCPSIEDLSGYLSGSCADNVAVRIEEHLQSCARCVEWCGQATIDDDLHGRLRQVLDHDANEQSSDPSGGEFPLGPFDSQAMTSSSAPRFAPGVVESDPHPSIEGYELLHEIGRGGMGVVHLAYQKSTKRRVALKVLLQGPFASAVAKRRFEREIELAAQLDHPHIVNVLESGIAAGRYYFAMRYVEGERLDRYLSQSGATIRETLALFMKVCDAVSYAHRKGVIHRDLKPSNILVNQSGEPCVMDFGLAKVHDPEAKEDATLLSLEGELMGTIPYMAPEQTTGSTRDVDTRTDVYALGVILYRLLTGDYPYRVTGGIQEALRNINEVDPARPSLGRSDIDDDVETIVLTALQKDPSHRYPSADNLARDVERYLEGKPIDAKRDSFAYVLRKTLARHRLAVAVSITVALAVGVALWMGINERRQRIRLETNAIVTALGANVTYAMTRIAEADGATKELLAATVGRLVASPSREERSTGARGGLLINPDAFWESVDGGPLWESGEWLELCGVPTAVQDAIMNQLRLKARTGSTRQRYVAFCLIGQMARPVAGVADMCQAAAMEEDDPGVVAAATWAVRRLGMRIDPVGSERVFVDDLSGMTYARIPAASEFFRGSDETDPDRDPQDEVRAVEGTAIVPVFIGQTEVTWSAVEAFLDDPEIGEELGVDKRGERHVDRLRRFRQSALELLPDLERRSAVATHFTQSWARTYCNWLSERGQDADPARRYRLPTEDEWEYACRAGSTARFCFGSDERHARYFANCNGSSAGTPHTASIRMPNAFGLFDMHGGMWEWTGSKYPRELAKGVPDSEGDLWVYRGGAYYSPALRCRCAQRNYGSGNRAWDYHGFRLVMELIEP